MTTDRANLLVGEGWHDRLEAGVRGRICGLIEELLEEELTAMLGRARYARAGAVERSPGAASEFAAGELDASDVMLPVAGQRNGHRDRQVMGTFGATTVSVPRARLEAADGKTSEWHSKTLPAYQRRTKEIDAVIAGSYLAGTNTRRVGRALAALFRGSVSKDTVSRVWRKRKGDWEAWKARDLSSEAMVRLILTARWCAFALTARRRRFRYWLSWVCVPTGKRFCCRCATWAARARRRGARGSMTLTNAA